MARKKKLQSTGQLDSVIGQGPDQQYVDFYNNQQQQKAQQAAQQQTQQAQKQKQPKKQGFLNKLVKGAENVGESTAKTMAQPFVDTGKQVVKQVKFLGAAPSTSQQRQNIIQNQQKTQQAIKQNKVSSQTQDLLKQASASGRSQAEKMISNGSKDSEIQNFLKKDVQALNSQTKKGVANAAQIASLAVGGGETAKVATGTKAGIKALAKPTFVNATAGAVGNAGSIIATNPNASKQDIEKAALTGGALGAGATVGGKVANKVFTGTAEKVASKTGIGSKKATKQLIENVKTNQALNDVPKNDLEKLANNQNTKSAKTAIAELPTESELPQPKAPEPPVQTEIPQRPVEQIKEDIKANDDHIKTITGKTPHTLLSSVKESPIPKEVQPYIDTHQELQKEYIDATTPTKIPKVSNRQQTEIKPSGVEPITVPIKESQPKSPIVGQSKLASSTEQKAIDKKLTQGFEGKPEYAKVNVADQAKGAIDFHNSDPEAALQVALGKKTPPGDLLPESVYTAVENHALKNDDIDTLRRLATESTLSSEATGMGQRIRLLGERESDSAVTAMRKISDARKQAVETRLKKQGSSVNKAISREVRKAKIIAKRAMPDITKSDWSAFVESIKC